MAYNPRENYIVSSIRKHRKIGVINSPTEGYSISRAPDMSFGYFIWGISRQTKNIAIDRATACAFLAPLSRLPSPQDHL